MSEVDVSSLTPLPEFQPSHMENLQQTLPQVLTVTPEYPLFYVFPSLESKR